MNNESQLCIVKLSRFTQPWTRVKAALFGILLVTAFLSGPVIAFAASDNSQGLPQGDPKDAADPNMDIKNIHREGNGKLVMQVFGEAGATVPDKPEPGELGEVFVYVFVTNNGIWVVNAHWECHEGPTGCDPEETHVSEWHAEEVILGDVDGIECVIGIQNERTAIVEGHIASIDVPEATDVLVGQTAAYQLLTNPDNPQQECIAVLSEVFDTTSG